MALSGTWRRVALAGGLGGLVNATLLLAGWPVEVENAGFEWHIVPAGFLHGSILALAALVSAPRARMLQPVLRLPWIVLGGWVAGYLSMIPIRMSLNETVAVRMLFQWPDPWWEPLAWFGGVTSLLIPWLAWQRREAPVWPNAVAGCAAGALGSLWVWVNAGSRWEIWYMSPLHGCIWGCFVGLAISRREPGPDK